MEGGFGRKCQNPKDEISVGGGKGPTRNRFVYVAVSLFPSKIAG